MAMRAGSLYAKFADGDGRVDEVTDKTISITYKDGNTVAYEIGKRFGKAAGDNIPHTLVSDLKEGQTVKKGDVLLYNTKFFVKDSIDPSSLVYKPGALARLVLIELPNTLEDSSVLSPEFAKKLTTQQTFIRVIKVAFNQEVRNLLTVGQTVDNESILCTLENPLEGNSDLFDEKALDTLKALSSNTPRAKHKGVIEKIEVLYAGEEQDMSESLQHITDKADKELIRMSKRLTGNPVTGQVNPGLRVEGLTIEKDMCAIKVYITSQMTHAIGDKLVIGNQLKSVVGQMMVGTNKTEDGQPIDLMYSYQGVANRIVLSAEKMGTTGTLCKKIGSLATAAYFGNKE